LYFDFATLAVEFFGLSLSFLHTSCQCSVNYFIYKSHAAMILLTINKWLLHYGCKSSCTVLQSTCNVALWEFNTPCCTLRVHHRNTASVTWSCFHQSAKQFVVGHTIIQDIYSCCMNQLFPSVLWHSWLD